MDKLNEIIIKFNAKLGNTIPNNVWMTVLVVYFCKTFYLNEIGSFSLKLKKAEDLITKQLHSAFFPEFSKNIFFGSTQKTPILSKNCKCGMALIRCENINSYQGDRFECDLCSATNKIAGGVYHCEACKFDLCEECNNESKIKCFNCEEGDLVWNNQKITFCNVCMRRRNEIDGQYSCQSCNKFNLCISCKALR